MATVNTRKNPCIVGTGFYVPERVVPNSYFDTLYKKDIGSFLKNQRNISERRWMDPSQTTSDLILPAATQAMAMAGITSADLDLIVVATDTPDYLSPSTAAVVSHKLAAQKAGTFDLNSACAGFVSALDLAGKYITADDHYRNILVVGAYAMSKWLNMDDYKIASLFADGAAAAVVRASAKAKPWTSHLWTDGQYHDYMGIYGGGASMPLSEGVLQSKNHLLSFPKRIPPETNGIHWPRISQILLDRLQKKAIEVDHYFITQFNVQSIYETLDKLQVPRDRAPLIMDRFGYTGSASVGMALADSVAKGKLHDGDLCLFLGSGGGMSMAALAMEWGEK